MAAAWVVGGAAGGSLASLPSSVLASALSTASVAQAAEAMCEKTFPVSLNTHAVVILGPMDFASLCSSMLW